MTASSSHDDLADLLGNLADADQGIDDETLNAIDNPKSAASDTDDDETTTDAHAASENDADAVEESEDAEDEAGSEAPENDLAAIAAAAAAEAETDSEGEGEPVAEAVFDTEEEAVAEATAVDETGSESASEGETEADITAAAEEAAHEAEVQEGVEALEAVAHGETLAEESEEMEQFAAAAAPVIAVGAGVATAKRRSGHKGSAVKGDAMKATMAPILLTVGLIVLIPAIWGTLLLMGVETFGSDRSNAKTMATFMLMCWPISIALIVTAVILFLQISKAKKKAEARAQRG